jgi:hypothetical protein
MKNIILILVILGVIALIYYLIMRNRTTTSVPIPENSIPNAKRRAFNENLIKLWVQHLIYTRLVVMAFLSGSPELTDLSNRLMQNQKDIGQLMGTVFGKNVGDAITNVLTKHIQITVQVLTAVKSNDKINQDTTIKAFYQNADDIGKYLDQLYRTNIFRQHLKMHIQLLIQNVVDYANKDYAADIKSFDNYVNAGVKMASDMQI